MRFGGRLVFKAHRLLRHSTLGSRVIKKKREDQCADFIVKELVLRVLGSGFGIHRLVLSVQAAGFRV